MMKEYAIFLLAISCVSASVLLDKKQEDADTYDSMKRSAAIDILKDIDRGDLSVFDDKREIDYNHALSFYDYIDGMSKRGCGNKFAVCQKLVRLCNPSFARNRRFRRKHMFAVKYCQQTCHLC